MRIVAASLLAMAVGTSAFGVSSPANTRISQTSLSVLPENMSEIKAKADRWREIKVLSDEEANAQLSGEELEAYNNYHTAVKEDFAKMKEIAALMLKDLNPPQVKPKGKNQRKRDKWARTVAIAEARAAQA